jgi:hypothetical protein
MRNNHAGYPAVIGVYTRMGPLLAVGRGRMGYDQRCEVGLLFSVTESAGCCVSCARWCRLPETTELGNPIWAVASVRMCRVCVFARICVRALACALLAHVRTQRSCTVALSGNLCISPR